MCFLNLNAMHTYIYIHIMNVCVDYMYTCMREETTCSHLFYVSLGIHIYIYIQCWYCTYIYIYICYIYSRSHLLYLPTYLSALQRRRRAASRDLQLRRRSVPPMATGIPLKMDISIPDTKAALRSNGSAPTRPKQRKSLGEGERRGRKQAS